MYIFYPLDYKLCFHTNHKWEKPLTHKKTALNHTYSKVFLEFYFSFWEVFHKVLGILQY